MSSTFAPEELTGFSALNHEDFAGYTYARVANPTVTQLEAKIVALEHTPAARCFASGMAASLRVIIWWRPMSTMWFADEPTR